MGQRLGVLGRVRSDHLSHVLGLLEKGTVERVVVVGDVQWTRPLDRRHVEASLETINEIADRGSYFLRQTSAYRAIGWYLGRDRGRRLSDEEKEERRRIMYPLLGPEEFTLRGMPGILFRKNPAYDGTYFGNAQLFERKPTGNVLSDQHRLLSEYRLVFSPGELTRVSVREGNSIKRRPPGQAPYELNLLNAVYIVTLDGEHRTGFGNGLGEPEYVAILDKRPGRGALQFVPLVQRLGAFGVPKPDETERSPLRITLNPLYSPAARGPSTS